MTRKVLVFLLFFLSSCGFHPYHTADRGTENKPQDSDNAITDSLKSELASIEINSTLDTQESVVFENELKKILYKKPEDYPEKPRYLLKTKMQKTGYASGIQNNGANLRMTVVVTLQYQLYRYPTEKELAEMNALEAKGRTKEGLEDEPLNADTKKEPYEQEKPIAKQWRSPEYLSTPQQITQAVQDTKVYGEEKTRKLILMDSGILSNTSSFDTPVNGSPYMQTSSIENTAKVAAVNLAEDMNRKLVFYILK